MVTPHDFLHSKSATELYYEWTHHEISSWSQLELHTLGILTTGFGALQGAVFSKATLHNDMYIVNLRGYHLHSKSIIDVIVEMELLNRFCMCDFAKLLTGIMVWKGQKNKVSGKGHLKTFFLSMFEWNWNLIIVPYYM